MQILEIKEIHKRWILYIVVILKEEYFVRCGTVTIQNYQ